MPTFSLIIQGEVWTHINRQIAEVRRIFPQAEVIVSTCQKPQMEILGADKVIISDDPGGFGYSGRMYEKTNNINRQIVSTLAGLKAASHDYAFKLRSDFFLTGNDFLKYWDEFPLSDKDYAVFGHKLLACCYFSRNPNSKDTFPFHPSDLAFFGRTKDLLKLFDVPLMSEEEAYWNSQNTHSNRYFPEQYLFINCLRKNGFNIHCDDYKDNSTKNIELTERFFASNFIFLTFEQFNLQPVKQIFNIRTNLNNFISCYTHVEWQSLYKKYVDKMCSVPLKDNERLKMKKLYRRYRFYRFISKLCAIPFVSKAKRREVRNKILNFLVSK